MSLAVRKRVGWLAGVCWIGLLTTGCGGSDRPSVSGKVTLDGTAIEEGEIRFVPTKFTLGKEAPTTTGAAIKQGAYEVPSETGPLPGAYRVEIRASRKTGKREPAVPPAPPGTMIDITEQYVPAKYNRDSELTLDITKGRNKKDFELSSK